MNEYIFDLHVHSYYSNDCKSNPKEIIKEAKRRKLTGLAITDHNTTKFHNNSFNDDKLIIIPGIEVSTKKGHIIGLGIKEEIQQKLSVIETIEEIRERGGFVIIPHPFDFSRHGIGKEIYKLKDVAIETQNGSCPIQRFNIKAKKWAKLQNLSETGGSDSHRIQDIGMAYTITEQKVETPDDLIELIRKGKTRSAGSHLTIPAKIVRTFQIHF